MPALRRAIVIPTYNEYENCRALLPALFRVAPDVRIIVVDDQSTDGTREYLRHVSARDARVMLIERKGERSFSASYHEGFHRAFANGAECILQMDADFSHDPSDVPRLFDALTDADVVIGSRYCPHGSIQGWPLHRFLISALGNAYASFVTKLPVRDTTAGFVAWHADCLRSVLEKPIAAQSYVFMVILKYRAWKEGATIKEIPICFREREWGRSKMTWGTIAEALYRLPALKYE